MTDDLVTIDFFPPLRGIRVSSPAAILRREIEEWSSETAGRLVGKTSYSIEYKVRPYSREKWNVRAVSIIQDSPYKTLLEVISVVVPWPATQDESRIGLKTSDIALYRAWLEEIPSQPWYGELERREVINSL